MTRRRFFTLIACSLALAAWASCARRLPPLPAPSAPRYPDFIYPVVPVELASDPDANLFNERGWRFLQAGDVRGAEREFASALKRRSAFFPAETGLGYVSTAQKDYRSALARFDRALQRSPAYVPALFGRADALLRAGRADEALTAFQAALAADPTLAVARERIQVLQLRVLQQQIASARKAYDAGRLDEARQAYERAISASPESGFLYRDLGTVLRRQGDASAALTAFRKAVALDPNDARSLVQMGEIFESIEDFDAAVEAYSQAVAIEPGEGLTKRLERARDRAALVHLPPEFAEIQRSPRITRADLAALIGVRFPSVLEGQRQRDATVLTDARGSWAARWILAVVRAGVMDGFPNHTFQPRASARRLDLARAASRLLNLAASTRPGLAALWQDRPKIADMPASHLSYAAVAQVVAAGVMSLDDGRFRPGDPVSGEEALAAMERLEAMMVGPGQ